MGQCIITSRGTMTCIPLLTTTSSGSDYLNYSDISKSTFLGVGILMSFQNTSTKRYMFNTIPITYLIAHTDYPAILIRVSGNNGYETGVRLDDWDSTNKRWKINFFTETYHVHSASFYILM